MDMKNNNTMYYDAFISYRHSDLDKFVAEELHKQLEMFKVPKKLVKCVEKSESTVFSVIKMSCRLQVIWQTLL